ncbi:MAG: 4a-hydroxytetrahydrobiopterin dehydratase [Sphingopyxis sp.]
MVARLNEAEKLALWAAHPAWAAADDAAGHGREAMVATFRFADFSAAFAFMTRVAMLAEQQDHHPQWSNLYNQVTILLTTHDADGLSARDARMAQSIDALLA